MFNKHCLLNVWSIGYMINKINILTAELMFRKKWCLAKKVWCLEKWCFKNKKNDVQTSLSVLQLNKFN